MSTSELDEKSGSDHGLEVAPNSLDTGAELLYGKNDALDPAEAERIKYVFHQYLPPRTWLTSARRKKIDLHLLPLMCSRCSFILCSIVLTFLTSSSILVCMIPHE
jgi:hypothetical protein